MSWKIPNMWEGGECWIIGGGPSMLKEFEIPEDVVAGVLSEELPMSAYSPYLSPLHNKHVIGVNTAFFLGSWIDFLFFGDGRFYLDNKQALDAFPKVKVTCHPEITKRKQVVDVKYVPRNLKARQGISQRKDSLSWNLNSGAASIGLAYWLGAKKIYLLGFDMMPDGSGFEHWHQHYKKDKEPKPRPKGALPFKRHLQCFPAVARDASKLGLEIINVSPNSAITAFKRVKLSEVL